MCTVLGEPEGMAELLPDDPAALQSSVSDCFSLLRSLTPTAVC